MYLVISKWVTAVKVSNFSCHYLRNRSTLDIGVLGYIGIVQHKEHSPEVSHIPPGTPCIIQGKLYFFRPLDAGLTSRMRRFDPRPVYVRLVVDKVALGQVYLPLRLFSSVRIIPPLPHTHLHLQIALTRRTNRDSWQLSKKRNLVSGIVKVWIQTYFHLVFKMV